MIYKEFKHLNYNVVGVKNNRFKSCNIEVMFRKNISKHDLGERILLADTMCFSTKTYKLRKELITRCQDLYNVSILSFVNKIGNCLSTSFSVNFLCPKYVKEKNYLEDVIKLLFDVILNPNITDDSFDKRSFGITKSKLLNDIKSINEDPNRVAISNSLKNAFKDSATSYVLKDEYEYLNCFKTENLLNTYKDMLANDSCDIFVVGDLNLNNIDKLINKYYINNNNPKSKVNFYLENKTRDRVLKVNEKGCFGQTNLIMIYNLTEKNKKHLQITPYIFNNIFGNGSLNSKLFKYLREENSLCYGVGCIYLRFDGLLIIKTALSKENVPIAIKLIKKALNEMINGEFLDSDLKEAKKSAIFSVKMSCDYIGSFLNNYIFNYYDGLELPIDRIRIINNITKNDIVNFSKNLKLNCIYTLEEDSNEED
jgi:predicted Zn-dependent peptidase